MLEAQFEYSAANQPVVLTPFILMGAMSPVTIPAALVQQIAEALTGIALSQLIRPGLPGGLRLVPVQHRHAVRARRPSARPESGIGLLCTGQIARHFGLPFRTGGGADLLAGARRAGRLRGADDADADVPGRRQLGDALGRLARGRPGRRLREVHHRRRAACRCCSTSSRRWRSTRSRWPSAPTRRSATAATSSARCTRWSGSAPASTGRCSHSSDNYERWMRNGGKDTAARAGEDLQEEARGLRAAAARRGDPPGAGGVRRPPPRRARRLSGPGHEPSRRQRARRRLRPRPRLPRPARASCTRSPAFLMRARRQHHGEPAVRRPAQRPVLHAHRLRGRTARPTADERCAPTSPRSPRSSRWTYELWSAPGAVPHADHGLQAAALPQRPALPAQHRRLQIEIPVVVSNHPDAEPLVRSPTASSSATSRSRPTPRPRPRRELLELRRRARHPPRRAGPLHAGPVRRRCAARCAAGRSTSTTRSCRASRAPGPTTRPSTAA